jgi:hypothetical protein
VSRSESAEALTYSVWWRRQRRTAALQRFTRSVTQLRWSVVVLDALIDELHVTYEFIQLLGRPEDIPVRRYPQAVAVAIALRHSWRPDLLTRVARHIRTSPSTHAAAGPRVKSRRPGG